MHIATNTGIARNGTDFAVRKTIYVARCIHIFSLYAGHIDTHDIGIAHSRLYTLQVIDHIAQTIGFEAHLLEQIEFFLGYIIRLIAQISKIEKIDRRLRNQAAHIRTFDKKLFLISKIELSIYTYKIYHLLEAIKSTIKRIGELLLPPYY